MSQSVLLAGLLHSVTKRRQVRPANLSNMLAAAVAHDVQITVSSVSVAIANLAQAVGVSSDSVVKVHLVSSSVEPPERPIKGPLKLFNEPPLPFSTCPSLRSAEPLDSADTRARFKAIR
jgi:hypothetical protein